MFRIPVHLSHCFLVLQSFTFIVHARLTDAVISLCGCFPRDKFHIDSQPLCERLGVLMPLAFFLLLTDQCFHIFHPPSPTSPSLLLPIASPDSFRKDLKMHNESCCVNLFGMKKTHKSMCTHTRLSTQWKTKMASTQMKCKGLFHLMIFPFSSCLIQSWWYNRIRHFNTAAFFRLQASSSSYPSSLPSRPKTLIQSSNISFLPLWSHLLLSSSHLCIPLSSFSTFLSVWHLLLTLYSHLLCQFIKFTSSLFTITPLLSGIFSLTISLQLPSSDNPLSSFLHFFIWKSFLVSHLLSIYSSLYHLPPSVGHYK